MVAVGILECAKRHADDLPESDDCAEEESCEIEPFGVQPIVEQFAEKKPEEDSGRNDEADLGVAGDGDKRIFFLRWLCRKWHCGIVIQMGREKRRYGELAAM